MAGKTRISCALLTLAVAALACSKSSNDGTASSADRTCDPLSAETEPITLGEIVGAGKAADGTVYVIDRGPGLSGIRGFVSEGSVLRRRSVTGTGEGSDFVIATLEDGEATVDVRVELAGGKATRMGISRGAVDPKTKSFDIGTAEELALLSPADVSTFQLANIAVVQLEYAASTADGHALFMFAPRVDYRDEEVRLFYGLPDRMIQRRIQVIARSSALQVEFDLEGVRATAVLTFCLTGSSFGPPRIEPAGGPAIPLTPIPGSPGALPCGATAPDAGDAGEDGGAGEPARPADPTVLTAGHRFVCF